MKINIGENIRSLRKEKGITQERLAELLGVTPQAVSRWESGAGYPDMEQLPGLASLFGVSMDTLLGYDGTKEKQDRLVLEIAAMIGRGETEECIRRAREAVEMYPANNALAILLATVLFSRKDSEGKAGDLEETVRLCNRVLMETGGRNSDSIIMALSAKNLLIPALVRLNRREEAKEDAARMPALTMTRDFTLPMVLTGTEKQEFLLSGLPVTVILLNNLYVYGYHHPEPASSETDGLSALSAGVEKYTLEDCRRQIAVWETVYACLPAEADGERELDSVEIYLAMHQRTAILLAGAGQYEEALVHLERAVRGRLRPAAEKRFHAFNALVRKIGERMEKGCYAAFENAPGEIKQRFDEITAPLVR